jgi:hypothetical protein
MCLPIYSGLVELLLYGVCGCDYASYIAVYVHTDVDEKFLIHHLYTTLSDSPTDSPPR